MSRLGLNEDERAFLAQSVLSRQSPRAVLAFYAGPLAPAIGFGVYGLVAADRAALGVAFVGLALFALWRIGSELANMRVAESLLAKVEAYERTGEPQAPPDGK